jgi:hypothetical protein
MNDIKFKQRCQEYEIDSESFEIYDNVILLKTPSLGLYILFDKNYNTIAIENIDFLRFSNKENMVNTKYYEYCNFTDNETMFGEQFGYPFENYTLKNIIDLATHIEIIESSQGIPLITKINNKSYYRKNQNNQDYFQLLSYIKFIHEEIQRYFILDYHMKCLGLEIPNIYAYTRQLIDRIQTCINLNLRYDKKPSPAFLASYLGQNRQTLKSDSMLYDIIELLIRDNGYEITSIDSNEVEKMHVAKQDLSQKTSQLLAILEENFEQEQNHTLAKKK